MNGEVIDFNEENGIGVVTVFNSRGTKTLFFRSEKAFESGELVTFSLGAFPNNVQYPEVKFFAENVQHITDDDDDE